MTTKAYSTASNARRAAKQAGFTLDQVEIINRDGKFWFEVKAAGSTGASQVLADEVDNQDPTEAEITESNASVTEAKTPYEFYTPTEAELAEAKARGEAARAGRKNERSTTPRPCKRVWIIADDMLAANPDVKRKDVMAACIAAGVAFYTARTQYQQWLGVRKEMAAREATQAK